MAVSFDLDSLAITRLSEAIKTLPNKAEKVINQTLLKKGSKSIEERITPLIPMSRERDGSGVRIKEHARNIKWSAAEQKENLSVTVKTKGGAANKKGSFGYLVFPNEGRGKYNTRSIEFMEAGRNLAIPKVIDDLEQQLILTIQEEIQ